MNSGISANNPLDQRVSDDLLPMTVSDETCPIATKKKCLSKILTAKGLEQKKIDIAHSQDLNKAGLNIEYSQNNEDLSQSQIALELQNNKTQTENETSSQNSSNEQTQLNMVSNVFEGIQSPAYDAMDDFYNKKPKEFIQKK